MGLGEKISFPRVFAGNLESVDIYNGDYFNVQNHAIICNVILVIYTSIDTISISIFFLKIYLYLSTSLISLIYYNKERGFCF